MSNKKDKSYLVVQAGSLGLADGRHFGVGVHEVDKDDEDVKRACADKDGCFFSTDGKDATFNSFVEQAKQQFPGLGHVLTNQQKAQAQAEAKMREEGKDTLSEAAGDFDDFDRSDPHKNGEFAAQEERVGIATGPEALAEKVAKN